MDCFQTDPFISCIGLVINFLAEGTDASIVRLISSRTLSQMCNLCPSLNNKPRSKA